MTTTIQNPAPSPLTREEALARELKGQELLLGRKQRALGEALADGLDTTQVSAEVDAILKRMSEIQLAIAALKDRATEHAETTRQQAEQVKQSIKQEVHARTYALVVEGQQKMTEMREYVQRLGAGLDALRAMGDPISQHQASAVAKNFKYHLLHAVRIMPGCELGLSAFLKFDEKPFDTTFPKAQA